jgi:hypothetical protein
MGSLLPRSRRASALRLGGPSARRRTPATPIAASRPTRRILQRGRRNRAPILAPRPVRAGESRERRVGKRGLAEPGSLAFEVSFSPEVRGAWPGSGNSWGLHALTGSRTRLEGPGRGAADRVQLTARPRQTRRGVGRGSPSVTLRPRAPVPPLEPLATSTHVERRPRHLGAGGAVVRVFALIGQHAAS